jgi:ARC6-like, IMS domain
MAASEEQLRQAYGDRIMQLPRREYSHAAITSRKKLIEQAYVILSDPRERKAYDKFYLAQAYGSESAQEAAVAVETSVRDNSDVDSLTPSIEISQDEVVGALLILQELGEYELVLRLGRPYLINKNVTAGSRHANLEENQQTYSSAVERSDVVLTVALACLELGREQWQQNHYENAAISLETGEELLAREGLFPNVRIEIQADLDRLRPYRILELLSLPEDRTAERKQGLQLLQDILDKRGGIDGAGNDQSGLSIDDFLRFVQQLRNYLTVAEQHQLFEEESKRPSSVATYLAVYALIARGFTERQPSLIRQAKQMLVRLGRRQDVHLEQSLCALLLGQTEEASRALELSQEYEALVFIRENSQDSPDLLPGLCLYGEYWLQNDVFPHFRDLVDRQASLKDYFAEPQVQAYLESLPTDAGTTPESTVTHRQSSRRSRRSNPTGVHEQFQPTRTPHAGFTETEPQVKPERPNASQPKQTAFPNDSRAWSENVEIPSTLVTSTEHISRGTYHNLNGSARVSAASAQPQRQQRQKRSHPVRSSSSVAENRRLGQRRRRFAHNPQAPVKLLWMLLGSVAGIALLWIVVSTTVGFVRNLFSPSPALNSAQLSVQLNEPTVSIPDRNSNLQLPAGTLTEENAREIIESWLDLKAAAFGPEHDIASLENILVGATLSKWRLWAQQEKANNRYRKYEHTVDVVSLDTDKIDQSYAAVEATVVEVTKFYENGEMKKPERDKVRVRYNLIRKNGEWRIQDMSVLSSELA